MLWNRIENKYLGEIEWYAECFADILNELVPSICGNIEARAVIERMQEYIRTNNSNRTEEEWMRNEDHTPFGEFPKSARDMMIELWNRRDGRTANIQYYSEGNEWVTTTRPKFNDGTAYRVVDVKVMSRDDAEAILGCIVEG